MDMGMGKKKTASIIDVNFGGAVPTYTNGEW
jgi:hypothetical protein